MRPETRFPYATRLNGFKADAATAFPGRNRITTLDLVERAVDGAELLVARLEDRRLEPDAAERLHRAEVEVAGARVDRAVCPSRAATPFQRRDNRYMGASPRFAGSAQIAGMDA